MVAISVVIERLREWASCLWYGHIWEYERKAGIDWQFCPMCGKVLRDGKPWDA